MKMLTDEGDDQRTAHVGYYLIGHGVTQTKKLAKMHEPGAQRMQYYTQETCIPGVFNFNSIDNICYQRRHFS